MSPKKFRTKKRTVGYKAMRQRMKDLKIKKGLKSVDIQQTEETVESQSSQSNNISITVTDDSNNILVDSFSSNIDITSDTECSEFAERSLNVSSISINSKNKKESCSLNRDDLNLPCIDTTPTKDSLSSVFTTITEEISDHNLSVIYTESEDGESSENTTTTDILFGRRIVDIKFVFDQILASNNKNHVKGFDCSFINSELIKETRKGFHCSWFFKCKMCNIETIIQSDINDKNKIPINKAVANASIAVGIGYSQVNEFSAFIDVPCMTNASFINNCNKIAEVVNESAWEQMRLAGLEEKKLALERNDVDTDGIPMCPVVADGQWGKRSYKTKYDSLSGAATIIGFHTSKVLFVGIRNRYCAVCERSKTFNRKPKEHECFMNWTKSSTCMEADGIAEGFLKSIELHGLKFNRLIGDGDSSVTKRLKEVIPYGPTRLVEKIECRNHLLRNFSTKISAISKNTKYPILLRNFIKTNIVKFPIAIRKAIKYRKNLKAPEHEKISGLVLDISNSFYHILGQHNKCDVYFCNNKQKISENLVPAAFNCGLMSEFKLVAQRLIDNATSLLHDVTNNICEQFNSVINKFIAGKRINFSQRNSYNTRVKAAIVSFNSGGMFLRHMHKNITNNSPGKIGKQFLSTKLRKLTETRKRRQLFPVKKNKNIENTGPDEFYGLAESLAEDDVMDAEQFVNQKQKFLASLQLSHEQRCVIEQNTRNQGNCQQWFSERRVRLTASNFGRVCKMRANTSCKNTVYDILYGNVTSKAMEYGKIKEDEARQRFETMTKLEVKSCGLFIDKDIPYLAASPDGLIIGENAIIEIKCPYSVKDYLHIRDAIVDKKIQYLYLENNNIKLKTQSLYYFQVQGQLRITNTNLCYFVIHSESWTHILNIEYDEFFWNNKMENQLKLFYLDCLLPEIIDPKFGKRLLKSDISEPKRIQDQLNKKTKNK